MKQYSTVDHYIAAQPEQSKVVLETIRAAVLQIVPEAEEVISYQMPAFKFKGMLLWYAAFQKHYSLFPYGETIVAFKDKLKSYELSKGTIRFTYEKPVPVKLIKEIARFRLKRNLEK